MEHLKEKLHFTVSGILILVFVGSFPILLFWGGVSAYSDSQDPFKTDSTKDFKLQAEVMDEASSTHNHYLVSANIRTDQCGVKILANCSKTINVTKIYWPDGGYTTFNDCPMISFDDLPQDCTATNGEHRIFGVVIHNQK